MIKRWLERLYDKLPFTFGRRYISLYVGMVLATVMGIVAGTAVYVIGRLVSYQIIDTVYATPEHRRARTEAYIGELQTYIDVEELSFRDTDSIGDWVEKKGYTYLTLYKDGSLYFSTDIGYTDRAAATEPPLPSDGGTLAEYAAQTGLYVLEFRDGALLASISEFTEMLYYDLGNGISLVAAMLAMSTIIIGYLRLIIVRIKRLGSDVTVVAYGDNSHSIEVEGYDDISKLASEVELMRQNMLDNISKERKARDANTDLITSMSHDIRTPLTVILGYLDMMKNELPPEQMASYVDSCEKTALRLKNLSDDMFRYFLAFGNTGDGISLEEYDAQTLLEQLLTEHLLLLSESGYITDVEEEDDLLEEGTTIVTDPPNLMRIIDNIFSNFYKYADKEHPVSLHLSKLGDVLVLKFTNRIKTDSTGVESNKIGLKSCARLAEFLTEGFEYKAEDGVYSTRMALKIIPPQKNSTRVAIPGEEIYDQL